MPSTRVCPLPSPSSFPPACTHGFSFGGRNHQYSTRTTRGQLPTSPKSRKPTGGTFGCLVRNRDDDKTLYILSSSHVLAEDDEAGSGQPGVAVAGYVKKKLPANRLAEKDMVPESLSVPGRNGAVRVPTRVIEQGEVHLKGADKEGL